MWDRMLPRLTQFLVTSCLLLRTSRTDAESLQFTCSPDGTVTIHNVPTSYVNVQAIQGDVSICDVTRGGTTVILGGCAIDQMIYVFMSEHGDVNVLASVNQQYIILCLQVPAEGVNIIVSSNLRSSIENVVLLPPITPTYSIEMHLFNEYLDLDPVWNANVGAVLYWTIDVPEQYSMVPLMCSAEGSHPNSQGNHLVPDLTLIENGCGFNPELVRNFGTPTFDLPGRARYFTTLNVFKFYAFQTLVIRCQVRICSAGAEACNIDCNNCRLVCTDRKRRNVPGIAYIRDLNAAADDDGDGHRDNIDLGVYVTTRSLDVIDLDTFSMSSCLIGSPVYTFLFSTLLHYIHIKCDIW